MKKILLCLSFITLTIALKSQVCGNLNFESGNFSGWALNTFMNMSTIPVQTCCAAPGSTASAIVTTPFTTPYMGILPHSPFGGTKVAFIGDSTANTYGTRATFSLVASGNMLQYAIAPVALSPAGHTCSITAYNAVIVRDNTGTAFYTNQMLPATNTGTCIGGSVFTSTAANTNAYGCWSTFNVNLVPYIGQNITVEVIAANCTGFAHWDYCFFDMVCTSATPTINACGVATGVSETTVHDAEISMWPNPAARMLNIGLPSASLRSRIEIYDLIGNLVLKQDLAKENNALSVEHLPQGIYIYKVISGEMPVKTGRFVKD